MTNFQTAVTGLKLYADRISRATILIDTLTAGRWSEGRALDCKAALGILKAPDEACVHAVEDAFGISIAYVLDKALIVLTAKVAAWAPVVVAITPEQMGDYTADNGGR